MEWVTAKIDSHSNDNIKKGFDSDGKPICEKNFLFAKNHDENLSGKIIEQTERKDDEKDCFNTSVADAYAKLAAEGARFQCVRNNIGLITNETIIYCKEGNDYYGISFKELWKLWTEFQKDYDIDDEKIYSVLKRKEKKISADEVTNSDNKICLNVTRTEQQNNIVQPRVFLGTAIVQRKMPEKMPDDFELKEREPSEGLQDKDVIINTDCDADCDTDCDTEANPKFTKIEALMEISKKAAALGTITNKSEMLNCESFYAIIGKKYLTSNNHQVSLRLKFEFRKGAGYLGGPGYVIEVSKQCKNREKKSDSEQPMKWVTAKIDDNDLEYRKKKAKDGEFLYSVAHSKESDKKIIDSTKRGKGSLKKTFWENIPDSYAKLAAEGARFKCVRENFDKITDETFIYIVVEKNDVRLTRSMGPVDDQNMQDQKKCYKCITFSKLWTYWSSLFEKKYDIDNETIASAIYKGKVISQDKTDLDEKNNICVKDYTVDSQKPLRKKRRVS